MPLGKPNVFTSCIPFLAVLLQATSSVLNHQGVFSVLERTLPIALFPRVSGTVRFMAVTKPNLLIVVGYMITVSSWDSNLYGKELYGIHHVVWQSRKLLVRFLMPPLHIWWPTWFCSGFRPAEKLIAFFFTFEKMGLTLGRDLCKMGGVLMDWLMDPVPFALRPEVGRRPRTSAVRLGLLPSTNKRAPPQSPWE